MEVINSFYDFVFPESVEGTLYSYDGTYQSESYLNLGDGYWI